MSSNDFSSMPEGYIPPNVEPQCSWNLGKRRDGCPHQFSAKRPKTTEEDILPNILAMVGNTPLVRLDKIAKAEGLKCDLLAKCEFFNAGGSVKDRVALRMVEDAEKSGLLKPGDTIIEPTSGNTGIGLAMASAVKGYKCIITMPVKMSSEKESVLQALGAEIIRTPNAAKYNHPGMKSCGSFSDMECFSCDGRKKAGLQFAVKAFDSNFGVAWKLKNEIPNAHVLDQYRNASNPLAHYDGTGTEILDQTGGKVDMVVGGAGTGGTISGIGRKIKEVLPKCKIICVDAVGSILAEPPELNKEGVKGYQVEGIGHDFIPTVFDRSVIDEWYKCSDQESFLYSRRLIKEEGLLCGGSSGAALSAALRAAKNLKAGQKCVVILPDSIRNYLSKFINDKWMADHKFMDLVEFQEKQWWWNDPVSALNLQQFKALLPTSTCAEAVSAMKESNLSEIPVVKEKVVEGVVKSDDVMSQILSGKIQPTDTVENVMVKGFKVVDTSTPLKELSLKVDKNQPVIVTKGGNFNGVALLNDLLEYIMKQKLTNGTS